MPINYYTVRGTLFSLWHRHHISYKIGLIYISISRGNEASLVNAMNDGNAMGKILNNGSRWKTKFIIQHGNLLVENLSAGFLGSMRCMGSERTKPPKCVSDSPKIDRKPSLWGERESVFEIKLNTRAWSPFRQWRMVASKLSRAYASLVSHRWWELIIIRLKTIVATSYGTRYFVCVQF